MDAEDINSRSAGYQLFMLALCMYALGALAVHTVVKLEPRTGEILDIADYVVCLFFLLDFGVSMHRARHPWRYLVRWGWLDLLSSIPSVPMMRWGRAARVLRVFRVLRGLQATRVVATLLVRRRTENAFLAASLVALLLIVFCSVAVLHFETDPDSNIRTAGDAIWWAFATITTVGYGDRFPVTVEGRVVAAVLMAAGVGLCGTFAGFLASWFIGERNDSGKTEDLAAVKAELAALRAAIEGLSQNRSG
jgi:voltage-gated potassium channel